jgi:hypothetical protein
VQGQGCEASARPNERLEHVGTVRPEPARMAGPCCEVRRLGGQETTQALAGSGHRARY